MNTPTILRTIETKTGLTLTLSLDFPGRSGTGEYVLAGGKHGEHRLNVNATDTERLEAHLDGYVEINGGELVPELDLSEIKLPTAKGLACGEDPAVKIKLPMGYSSIEFETPEGKAFVFEAMPYAPDGAPQCVDLRPRTPNPDIEQWKNGDDLIPRWRTKGFGEACKGGGFGRSVDAEVSTMCLIFDWDV